MKFNLLLIFVIFNLTYSITIERKLWSFFTGALRLTDAGAAALMGNLYAESGLKSEYYDIAYHQKLGLTDSEYVDKVNSGEYSETRFINDNIGFGLVQWRDKTSKRALYDRCKGKIGDLDYQLNHLKEEFKSDDNYKKAYILLSQSSHINACNTILFRLIFNIDTSDYNETYRRIDFSKGYYNTFSH